MVRSVFSIFVLQLCFRYLTIGKSRYCLTKRKDYVNTENRHNWQSFSLPRPGCRKPQVPFSRDEPALEWDTTGLTMIGLGLLSIIVWSQEDIERNA